MLPEIIQHSRVRVVFGAGALRRLGELVVDEGGTRVLLVTDPGIVKAGHAERALESLRDAGVEVTVFSGVEENPTTDHVAAGVTIARDLGINFLVGLGGGSSMDCAKGINFLLTNGGCMEDYWGVGKATKPMLPLIAVPTTAGTGSEAQSFALITDPDTHQKMACGDEKALARVAILDPDLTATQPRKVAAATSIDAVAHAVETAGTKKRTELSRQFSREAWARLEKSFETAIREQCGKDVHGAQPPRGVWASRPHEAPPPPSHGVQPPSAVVVDSNAAAREDMLLGAHLAGIAIEKSMLGAAHSCANPLTSEFGVVHGVAVGLMLPHVVRFNAGLAPFGSLAREAESPSNTYADLSDDAESLARRIESMLNAAGLPRRLDDLRITAADLPKLAALAAKQWTAQFNPRLVGPGELEAIYRAAL